MPERADGRLDLCEDLRGPVLGPPLGRLTRGPPTTTPTTHQQQPPDRRRKTGLNIVFILSK